MLQFAITTISARLELSALYLQDRDTNIGKRLMGIDIEPFIQQSVPSMVAKFCIVLKYGTVSRDFLFYEEMCGRTLVVVSEKKFTVT